MKSLLAISIPVAAASLVTNISNLIDDITIRGRLVTALNTGFDTVKGMYLDTLTVDQTLEECFRQTGALPADRDWVHSRAESAAHCGAAL